jgi:hypothetical protein
VWSGRKRTIKQMPRIVCCYRFMGLFVTRRLMTQLSPGPDLERRIWNKLCARTVIALDHERKKIGCGHSFISPQSGHSRCSLSIWCSARGTDFLRTRSSCRDAVSCGRDLGIRDAGGAAAALLKSAAGALKMVEGG